MRGDELCALAHSELGRRSRSDLMGPLASFVTLPSRWRLRKTNAPAWLQISDRLLSLCPDLTPAAQPYIQPPVPRGRLLLFASSSLSVSCRQPLLSTSSPTPSLRVIVKRYILRLIGLKNLRRYRRPSLRFTCCLVSRGVKVLVADGAGRGR